MRTAFLISVGVSAGVALIVWLHLNACREWSKADWSVERRDWL